jgi:hypothetical protein
VGDTLAATQEVTQFPQAPRLECQMKHEDFDSRVDAVRHSASYRLLQRIGIFPAIDSAEPGATKD